MLIAYAFRKTVFLILFRNLSMHGNQLVKDSTWKLLDLLIIVLCPGFGQFLITFQLTSKLRDGGILQKLYA